ncbi:hypothetical protein Acr_00g0057510 [Actinidia rufa]|uniref:Integrase catalytic domain-containing protein n=1 Tax=Actinidia rufa TaxID=165716 RepID=A0A7J0DMK0_9ERIC|nr:hypothetical protein Acr_00g0057510 [Actinidia rufa]
MVIDAIGLKMYNGTIKVLTDAHYVPNLKKNLISLGDFDLKGRAAIANSNSNELGTSRLWHMRLGHAGEKTLQSLVKQCLLKDAKAGNVGFCEYYVLGKQIRVKFGIVIHRIEGTLDYIYFDVWGPSKNASLGGLRYFVTFIDDLSKKVWVYTMRHKDKVLKVFLRWKKMIKIQTDRKIKKLRSDNGEEYRLDSFFNVCSEEGIVRHFTIKGMPQQHGVEERMNNTLVDKVRYMLFNAGLSKAF